MINPAIFRAYDIRGNSNRDLSQIIAYKIGYIFAKTAITNTNQLICVGRDGRLSSEELSQSLMQGIKDAGGKIKFIGLVATPTLYFADKIFSPAGSIMVTGSHNPKDDNGFKMLKDSNSFFGSMIQDLKQQIMEYSWPKIEIDESYAPPITEIKEQYIERILLNRTISKNLKVAFDPANGSGAELTTILCSKLPCKTFVLNEQIDGNFPAHDPDPTIAKNLEQLKNFVLANDCDIGIGFDGDADRIGIVTKKGNVIFGDQLLCLYAKDVLNKNPGAQIIADVKASQTLFDFVKKNGGNAIMWRTGHSFIKAKMKETGAKLAGEMSGHIFFADDYYGYDDAIYSAVRLIDILSNSTEGIDEMIEKLPKTFTTPEMKISVKDEEKFNIIEQIKSSFIAQNIDFIDIDGLRVPSKDGWWLLRASNTGPALTARCESFSEKGLEKLKNELMSALAMASYMDE